MANTRTRTSRFSVYLAVLTALAATIALPVSTVAVNHALEVIAVEDITGISACETTIETYTDEARRQPIARTTTPCSPGSVLRSARMTGAQARALGLPSVAASGDPAADERAVDALKVELLAALRPTPQMSSALGLPVLTTATNCGLTYQYTRYMSYNAEGGTVRTGVQYADDPNWTYGCNTIAITRAFSYLTAPLAPGNDLYWDQGWYASGISAGGWDMGCQQFQNNGAVNNTYMNTWVAYGNDWYVDESINDTSLGCEWWGEEYTGSNLLSTY